MTHVKKLVVTPLALLLCLVVCAVAAGVQTSSAKAQLCGGNSCLGGGGPNLPCNWITLGITITWDGGRWGCTNQGSWMYLGPA